MTHMLKSFVLTYLTTMALWFSPAAFATPEDPVLASAQFTSSEKGAVQFEVGLTIDKGYRVYRDSVKVEVEGATIPNLVLPEGSKRFDPLTKKEKEIYSDAVKWSVKATTAKPSKEMTVSIGYRACNDQFCHFPKTKKLKVTLGGKAIQASVFGSIESFWNLLRGVDAEKVKLIAAEHMWFALLLCFASGLLTSLTPCVYPMIPITINIFGRAAQKGNKGTHQSGFHRGTFLLSVIYVMGMCTTYSVMGLAAGLTGSLFGKILQSSFMLGFLTILFFTLAMGQFGLFKMSLPASWQTKISQVGNAENPFGIFLMGLFSGLIVSPCVGPVIAGILAFVFDTSSALRGLLYFLSFSLGLGMLFLVIGGFSGFLAKLPRSGSWMLRVNRVLASLMLIAAIYYGTLWGKQVGMGGSKDESPTVTNAATTQWLSDENTALALNKEKQVPVVIDFTAEWCEACHELDKQVFQNPQVSSELSKLITVRIDVTRESPENEARLKKFGIFSLPAIVFVDRQGNVREKPRIHGLVSPDAFLAALNQL